MAKHWTTVFLTALVVLCLLVSSSKGDVTPPERDADAFNFVVVGDPQPRGRVDPFTHEPITRRMIEEIKLGDQPSFLKRILKALYLIQVVKLHFASLLLKYFLA